MMLWVRIPLLTEGLCYWYCHL